MNLESISQYNVVLSTIENVWYTVKNSKQQAIILLDAPSGMKKTEIVLHFLQKSRATHIRSRGTGVPSPYLPFHVAYQSIFALDTVQQVLNNPDPNQLPIGEQRLLKTLISAAPFLQPITIPDLALSHQWQTSYQPTFELETSSDIEDHVAFPRPITLPNRLVATLGELTAVSPLLFFLDDLDLVDDSSLDALSRELLPALQSAPIVFLFAFSSAAVSANSSLSRFIEDTKNSFAAEHLTLPLLQENVVKQIVVAEFTNWGKPTTDELISKISNAAVGNLAQLQDILSWLHQRYLRQTLLLSDEIPTHAGLMSKQFSQLDHLQEKILYLASCQGRYFCAEVLAKVLAQPSFLVLESLNKVADETGWVKADTDLALESQTLHWYRFRGHKQHEWIYGAIPEGRLATYHRQTGEALETIYDQRTKEIAGLLADQFEKAEDYIKAAEYLYILANQANHQGDAISAQRYAKEGLDYLQGNKSYQELNCRLAAELGKAYQRSEKAYLAIDILEKSRGDATSLELGDELIIDIEYNLGQALLDSNRWDAGIEILFKAVDKAIEVDNSFRAAEILESCRIAFYIRGDTEFLNKCDGVIALLEKQSTDSSNVAIAEILEDKGWFFLERREVESAIIAFTKAFAVLSKVQEQHSYPEIFYKLHYQQASALRFKGEYSRALEDAENAITWAIVCRRRDYEANGNMIKAIILDSTGDLENAELTFKKAIALLETHPNPYVLAKVAEMYGLFLSQTGRKLEALEQYTVQHKYSVLSHNERQAQVARNDIAAIHKHLGKFSESLASYQQLLNEGIAQQDVARQIVSLNHIGDIYRIQGNLVQSEGCHLQAIQLCSNISKLSSKLVSFRYVMRTYIAGLKYADAENLLDQFYDLSSKRVGRSDRDYFSYQIFEHRLRFHKMPHQNTLDDLLAVAKNLRATKDLLWVGLAHTNLSLGYLLLGQQDVATIQAQHALNAFTLSESWRVGDTRQLLARCQLASGNLEEAQKEIVEAKTRFMQLQLFHRVTETETIETAIEIAQETNNWQQWREFTLDELEQTFRYVGI